MRTEIHPKGCKTHDGIRTVKGCAVCRAEKIEAALRAIVDAHIRAVDEARALARSARELIHLSVLEEHPLIARARAALSEEEGTPADCQVLTQAQIHDAGFRAGVEAAAKEADGIMRLASVYGSRTAWKVTLDRIRALSPSPATPSEERCTACGHDASWHIEPSLIVSGIGGECRKEGCRCGGSGRATPRGQG